mgnify:CR=1 FL=1
MAGRPYILDATAARVDRIVDGTARPVLARGQVVGADTVADLLDLFWLPPPSGEDGRVVVLDAAGRLWALHGDDVRRVSRAEAPGWANVVRAAGYGGSLYVVDRGGNQIFRYAGDAAFPGFSAAGAAWLTTPEPLADAVDLAIDGAIYVLFADGPVHRYVGGRLDDAFVTDPRAATTDARALYTSPTAGRLLVADRAGGRVVVLGIDGGYEAELLQPTQGLSTDPVARAGRFAALSDAWWDEAGGVLYLIASGQEGFKLSGGFASNGYGAHSPGGYSLLAALVCVAHPRMFRYVAIGILAPGG